MAVLNIRAHQFFTCCLQSTTSEKSIISYKPSVTAQAVKSSTSLAKRCLERNFGLDMLRDADETLRLKTAMSSFA